MYNGRKDYAESKTMTDLMASLGDNRQAAFGGASEATGNVTTSNVGVPYGLTRAKVTAFTDANPTWARVLRGDFRVESGTVQLVTAAMVTLARASAANLGWTTEITATLYIAGINLSFEQWGLAAPAATYFTQAGVALGANGSVTSTKNIAIQRYIASYPNPVEAWSIWRKTGYPVLTPAPDAVNASKQIPQRFVYSTSEYNTNGESVNAAVGRVSGTYDQDAKVWWAK
jgi:hypothetical protein